MASIGAFASLPLAERAAAARQYVKAAGLGVLFGLMAIYSLTASLDRVAGGKDTAVATVQGDNNRTSLAKEGYETAKAAKETECASGRGKKCRDAEAALEAARKVYMAAPPKREEDLGRSASPPLCHSSLPARYSSTSRLSCRSPSSSARS